MIIMAMHVNIPNEKQLEIIMELAVINQHYFDELYGPIIVFLLLEIIFDLAVIL